MLRNEEEDSLNAYFTMWNSDHLNIAHYSTNQHFSDEYDICPSPELHRGIKPTQHFNAQEINIISEIQCLGSTFQAQTIRKKVKNKYVYNTSEETKTQWAQSKNKNVLKFMLKLLRDRSGETWCKLQKQHSGIFTQMKNYLMDLFAWNRMDPTSNNINIDHLKKLLQLSFTKFPQSNSFLLRLGIEKILQRFLRAQILSNTKCTNKQAYLNTLKVYKLRCRNKKTALRMQN